MVSGPTPLVRPWKYGSSQVLMALLVWLDRPAWQARTPPAPELGPAETALRAVTALRAPRGPIRQFRALALVSSPMEARVARVELLALAALAAFLRGLAPMALMELRAFLAATVKLRRFHLPLASWPLPTRPVLHQVCTSAQSRSTYPWLTRWFLPTPVEHR